ncbi:hypothetical protein HYH03_002765 [Edaphochlamys debaryana]|uniref:Small-subunit processome Utp12 domain-containing protein n=1 Tax=Edaphochlamys debaryana TaxID=47281 RepID=A0A835YCH3_9CHLO|nr:hypothetical protein HYH03_002765 [Edaphochlamys debaryana]|eukprot:KAG2499184.1 hypothetical protein HYH03_002765 [Edaphochlamys debaryana]
MAASRVCSHSAAQLVGATYDQSARAVVVTVQRDGVTAYDLEQRQLGSYPLGSRSTVEFQVASVQHTTTGEHARSIVASVLHDQASNSYTLCQHDTSSPARSITDAKSRVVVPAAARSVHILSRASAAGGSSSDASLTRIAVVLTDGRLGVAELGAGDGADAGTLTLLPSGLAAAPRHVLAASTADTLVVASQAAAGGAVTLRVLRLSSVAAGDGGVAAVKTLSVACPGGAAGAAAVPTGLTVSPAYALLQWSCGHATAVHGLPGGAATAPLHPTTFPLADAVGTNGASSSAPAAAAGGAASTRKRKSVAAGAAAADGAGGRARVLCAALDERQFALLDLESAAAQSQVCYSLHDAQFGCPLASGAVDLDAPLLSLDPASCSVAGSGSEGEVVLRLGGSVHVVTLQTQPVSLLSLVAKLSVSANAAAAAAAAGRPRAADAAAGSRGVAAALAAMPAPVALDPGLLAGGGAAAAAAAAAATSPDDVADVVLEPVPAASVSRAEDICSSLVEQLAAALAAAAAGGGTPAPPAALLDSAVSYISGRRTHAMSLPPQLLSLTARALAAAKQWPQLGALLGRVPAGGLSGCSDVLVAATAAAQYGLLSRLCTCLDEVEPAALVSTLGLLLAPTTQSNLAARKQHYEALRASAEARVAEAETAVAAAAAASTAAPTPRRGRGGGPAAVADPAAALALAQCAAAAVDGFSYREALLHPLVSLPVDSPAVQVALRKLPPPQADALLDYLAKWAAKYGGGGLGELAAGVVLPQELLFPYYHQVLEWARMTIDAHLARLLTSRTPLPALAALEASLAGALEGSRRLLLLRGALEHVVAGAALPAAHLAVATQYTAEVLDLRVR